MNEFKNEDETIGTTENGPVYAMKDADDDCYANFTDKDHIKAMNMHKSEGGEMHTKLADTHRKASLKAKHTAGDVGESRRIKSFGSFGVNEAKKVGPQVIGKAGKEKIKKQLYALVDKYLKDVNEQSNLEDLNFYVKDLAKWNDGSGSKPSKARTK